MTTATRWGGHDAWHFTTGRRCKIELADGSFYVLHERLCTLTEFRAKIEKDFRRAQREDNALARKIKRGEMWGTMATATA